jgi:Ser/Thr protein kinase RdoA (MazF antagonist)
MVNPPRIPLDVARFLALHGFDPSSANWCTSGLSGARVAKVFSQDQQACLKRWPLGTKRERVVEVHQVLNQIYHHGCRLVPKLFRSLDLSTHLVDSDGYHWELAQWFDGVPSAAPANRETLVTAGEALAHLHEFLARLGQQSGQAPNLKTRLHRLNHIDHDLPNIKEKIQHFVRQQQLPAAMPSVVSACQLWSERSQRAIARLARFVSISLPLHYVLRDIHRDHLLFRPDATYCFIDFDAMRIDTPLTDLARLLGSLGGDRTDAVTLGIEGYRRYRSLSNELWEVVELLDQTTSLAAMMTWVQWILLDSLPDNITIAQAITRMKEHSERVRAICP